MPPSGSDPDDLRPASFEEEEAANLRRQFFPRILRGTLAFAALFALVFFAFWWSAAAIRFGASRVADRPVAAWRVSGTVRNVATHQPVPSASIDDDPSGQPPFFHADADRSGAFELLTLPEPHRVRVSAPGYRTSTRGRWQSMVPMAATGPGTPGRATFSRVIRHSSLRSTPYYNTTGSWCMTRH